MAKNKNRKYVTIHPILPQLEEYLALYFFMGLYGGRDSGKTVAMVHLIIFLAVTGSHKIAVFRAEESQLEKESIKAMIERTIYGLGLSSFCRRIGRRLLINNKIEFNVNGIQSTISFDFVGNSPEKLRGTYDGYDIFVFEEFHQFPKRVLEVAIPTIERAPNNPHLLATCNLEDQDTYAYELIKLGAMDKEEQGWQQMIKELYDGDSSKAVYPHFGIGVEMLYDTNPYLTRFALQRITALKHSNYEEYLIIYRNHPRKMKDEIIIRDWKIIDELNITFDEDGETWLNSQYVELDNNQWLTIDENRRINMRYGQDYGTNAYFVNIECCYFQIKQWDDMQQEEIYKKYIYIHRVVMERHLDNMLIVPRIIERMPEQMKMHKKAIGDCARKDLIMNLNNGFRGLQPSIIVEPCEKWTDDNSNPNTKGSILDGITFLKSCTILVNKNCQYNNNTGEYHCDDVIFQLKNYLWHKMPKTDIITDKPVDANNDLQDAMRYAFQGEIQGLIGEPETEYSDDFWEMQRAALASANNFGF